MSDRTFSRKPTAIRLQLYHRKPIDSWLKLKDREMVGAGATAECSLRIRPACQYNTYNPMHRAPLGIAD